MPDTAEDSSPESTIRIFISSPGDVAQERVIAERVAERLQGEFARRAELDVIRWEREPLRATEHFQEQITPPAETDIALFILWSRLGTPLPEDQFQKEGGEQYRSGTEWEFENAVEGYRERGTPDLLTYRKTKDPEATLSDEEDLQQRLEQKEALEAFIDRWFRGEDRESFRAAFHTFEEPADFERMLEEHLRKLVEKRLPERPTESGRAGPKVRSKWHQGSPFRGLRPFEEEHAPIFFGRTEAVTQIIERLERQAEASHPFMLVHGPSGSGKSSVVRAGVVPTITRPGVIEGIGHWRQAYLRPSGVEEGLVKGLASTLFRAVPELEDTGFGIRGLTELLVETPGQVAAPLRAGLQNAAESVAEENGLPDAPEARILLAVDQLEEMFTMDAANQQERADFAAALRGLVESDLVWTIATLRSDFFPRLSEVGPLQDLKQGDGNYDLDPPSFAELGLAIRGPVRAAGLRFERDPDRGIGLDEVLHEAAAEAPEALPLLEFTLEELYRRRTEEDVLTFEAYEDLSELKGAIAERAESVFTDLDSSVQSAFDDVMRELVTIEPSEEESATSRRARLTKLTDRPEKEALTDALVEARLLVTSRTDAGEGVVGVAHEALLREWPRLQEWIERNRAFLQTRARVQERAARWDEEGRPADLLLPTGQPLAEARGLIDERGGALSDTLQTYVERSIERVERWEQRRRRIIGGAVAAFVLLVAGFGFFSYQQWTTAAKERDQSLRSQSHYLADQARQQTEEGDAMTGMLLALEALPENLSHSSRPFVEDAASALRYSLIRNRELGIFDGHGGPINDLSVSPNGHYAASASKDSTAHLYDLATRKRVKIISKNRPVRHVEFLSNDQLIVVSGSTIHVRSVPAGKLNESIVMQQPVKNVIAGPAGEKILAELKEGQAIVKHLSSGKTLLSTGNEEQPIRSAEFVPQSEILILAEGGSVRAYDIPSGKATELGSGDRADHVSVSADGRLIGALVKKNSYRSSIQLWEAGSWEEEWRLPISPIRFQSPPYALGPEGTWIAVIPSRLESELLDESAVERMEDPRVYSLSSSPPDSLQLGPFEAAVQDLAFSPNGSRIVTVTADGGVSLWNARTGNPLHRIPSGIPSSVDGVHRTYFAGGGELALTHSGEAIRLWKSTWGPRDVVGRKKPVLSFQLAANGERLAASFGRKGESAREEGKLVSFGEVYESSSEDFLVGQKKNPLADQENEEFADGSRVLDLPSGGTRASFQHQIVKLSPRGRFAALLAQGEQNQLVLKKVESGREIWRVPVWKKPPVRFSQTGRYVATLSPDSGHGERPDRLIVYDLQSEAPLITKNGTYTNFGFWKGNDAIFANQGYPLDTSKTDQTKVWGLRNGQELRVLPDLLEIGPSKKTLVTASEDSEEIQLFQSLSESAVASVDTIHEYSKALRYRFSGDGHVITISREESGFNSEKVGAKVITKNGAIKCEYIPIEYGEDVSSALHSELGYEGSYIGWHLPPVPGFRPHFSSVASCNSMQLNSEKINQKYGEDLVDFERTIIGPSKKNIISPLEHQGNQAISFWRARDGSYVNALDFDFIKLARTKKGKGYLVLQRFEDGKRVAEDLHLWQASPLQKRLTLPGHVGGIEYRERSRGSKNLRATTEGNIVSLSSSGRLKVWPLFLEDPQALIDYARQRITRDLTDTQREKFNLVTEE